MATAHTFLATDDDLPLILDWLKGAGAIPVAEGLEVTDFGATGHEIALYFPAIGNLHFWENRISLSEFPENSAEWTQTFLTKLKQEEAPDRKRVDPNKTPSAGLKLPELRDDRYWVSGELWFPTINLRKKFPELGKICGRFERWIRKFPCVFDNWRHPATNIFPTQIAQADIVKHISALPQAHRLLQDGNKMFDYMVSAGSVEIWKERWKV